MMIMVVMLMTLAIIVNTARYVDDNVHSNGNDDINNYK